MMTKKILSTGILLIIGVRLSAQSSYVRLQINVPLGSIRLSDPFILADKPTSTYYMTGTCGLLWKSRDLKWWTGPYRVVRLKPGLWMGTHPMIWAAELHYYHGRYYYFATFTNSSIKIGTFNGNLLERRACHILVSDHPDGPYIPVPGGDSIYLPADESTLDATFWIENGAPYMIYCHEWVQNNNGTVEKIALKPDLSGVLGKGKVLFRASDSPWSREKLNGKTGPNRVTDGPYVFRTKTGKLGMLWTSWVFSDYTQGVAYSASGKLAGPWIQEKEPVTPPDFGHGMLFRTFDGKLLMAVHSHKVDGKGHYIRIPCLFEMDDSGDKLVVKERYDFK